MKPSTKDNTEGGMHPVKDKILKLLKQLQLPLVIAAMMATFNTPGMAFTTLDSDPNRLPTLQGVILFSSQNHIVRDSAGNLYTAYTLATNQSVHYYNYLRSSSDDGATWSGAVRTDSMPDSSSVQNLVIDAAGNLYEGFTFNVGSFFTQSTDQGQTWSYAQQLHDGGWGSWDYQPSVVVDGSGILHVVYFAAFGWQDYPFNLIYKQSTDNGTTWVSETNLTNFPNDSAYGYGAQSADLYAGPDGQLFVCYSVYHNETAPYRITRMLLHFDGTAWSQPIPVSEPDISSGSGDLAVDDSGTVHLVYHERNADTNNYHLAYRTYDPETQTLSTVTKLTPGTANVWNSTIGIYAGNQIVIAFDTYDETDKKYGGVYVMTSTDTFADVVRISRHPEARMPNLRSSFYYMNQPDKIDIVWVEPNDVSGGEDLVYDELSKGITLPENLMVNVWGPKIANPGQDAVYLVKYKNGLKTAAEDVVVKMSLPDGMPYVSSTNDGIYKADEHEVIWKLGNPEPNAEGSLAVVLHVPWGSVNRIVKAYAKIDGSNAPAHVMDLTKYLNYTAVTLLSEKILTQSDIQTLLATDAQSRTCYEYAVNNGYQFYNTVKEIRMSDGSLSSVWVFIKNPPFELLLLQMTADDYQFFRQTDTTIEFFDLEGGLMISPKDGTHSTYGLWNQPSVSTARAAGASDKGTCIRNCMVAKGAMIPVDMAIDTVMAPFVAGWGVLKGGYHTVTGQWEEVSKDALDALPYKSLTQRGVELIGCKAACEQNPSEYDCAGDSGEVGKKWCEGNIRWQHLCAALRMWRPSPTFFNCKWNNQVCLDGECVDDACRQSVTRSIVRTAIGSGPLYCDDSDTEIVPAHDPNAKSVDPGGNVVPGQVLIYTIEYENTGMGTAYNVFIVDVLDEDLNDATLSIQNGGAYSSSNRLLSWNIGTVEPCDDLNPDRCKGSVSFSVAVKTGLASGTGIINYADVHFPSAGEITPTNPVLNEVRAIAADPKSAETISGSPVSIMLSGKDAADGTLTYRLTSNPLNGTVAGTPPNISYTSTAEFSGQDEFRYVVNNGIVDSDPAKITVIVNPNPADQTPPGVTDTYPKADATDVPVYGSPVSTSPERYLPTITAVFSESLDQSTMNTTSFTIDGLTGIVVYNDQTKTASFVPSTPLNYSFVYTAKLSTAIKDKIGNPMASEHVWTFTTVSAANISAVLPHHEDALSFDAALEGSPVSQKTFSIMNTGTQVLTIGSTSIQDDAEGLFQILKNGCTGATLGNLQDCAITVGFDPRTAGEKTARMVISSDDPDTPDLNVLINTVASPEGDMDGDGDVDLNDLIIVMRILTDIPLSGLVVKADINGDGMIGIEEGIRIMQRAAGL